MNQQEAWNNEYLNAKGVPTSTRMTPSSAVKRLVNYIDEHRPDLGKTVIDLGCGVGRNSMYFAGLGYTVTAVDFAASAISKLQETLKTFPQATSITLKQLSLADPLPFADQSFDLAIDIVTTMTLLPSEMPQFEEEIRRIVKPKGLFLTYVLSSDDGFLQSTNPGADSTSVEDSGITDHYFTESYLRSLYLDWNILVLDKIEKQDDFYGQEYTRRIWWMLLEHK